MFYCDDFWISSNSITKLVQKIDNEKINFVSAKVKVVDTTNKSFYVMGNKWDYRKLSNNINIAHPGHCTRLT